MNTPPMPGMMPQAGAPMPGMMPQAGAPMPGTGDGSVDPYAYQQPQAGAPMPGMMPQAGAPMPGMMPQAGAPMPGMMPQAGAPMPGMMPQAGAPMPGMMPQAGAPTGQSYNTSGGNRPQKINKIVGKVTHTGNQLFEISGAVDITDKFPDAIGFVMMVPSRPDNTKASGKTYVMNDKIVMKFSSEELHSLGEALKEAAIYGRCSFIKFSDPKKSDSSSNAETKKFSVSAIVEGETVKVFMALTWGQKKISMPLTKYAALGLGNQVMDLATATNLMKFEVDRSLVTMPAQ